MNKTAWESSVQRFGLLLCFALVWGSEGRAQVTPGVTEKEIVIGSCAALEGPSRFLGRETVAGAEAYFRMVNEEGGVHGRKLKLISFDDNYDPEKAQGCWDKLMADKPFALGFFVGTPTAVKYVPLAEKNQIPIVGLFTGAQTLYTPLRHWVVNVRASYFDETRAQIDGLWKDLHYKKIGIIYPDDPFGSTVLAGVEAALTANGGSLVASASYQRQTNETSGAIDKVKAANPDAVIVVGPSNTVAPIVKQAHTKGWKPLFVTVSFVGTDDSDPTGGGRCRWHGDNAGGAALLLDGFKDGSAVPANDVEVQAGFETEFCEP